MSSELVSLAWDGHHRTLVSVFEKLLVNSHFVDCTIAAEGQKMKAHKEVLSAFSPFFKLLFREETENNPTVIISGISFKDLSSLVDFMYQGKLEVTEDRIQDLIDAAECLQIDGLGGGHKKDDSGNLSNSTVLFPKRPALSSGIPHKRTRNHENEVATSEHSKESEVNKLNYFNEIRPENSAVMRCETRQSSRVQNLRSNSGVQNVAIVSNVSLMPGQSVLSEIEMDSLHLKGECVVKKEPDSGGDEYGNGEMREERRGYLYENSGEETILGLSAISASSEKNVREDSLLDCLSPAVSSSELCSRNLNGSSVINQLNNMNVKLSSVSVDPVVPALDTRDPLFHSEFHMKSEDESLLCEDNDLICENDDFSANMPESFPSFSEMQMREVCTENNNHCSGAAKGCISESTSTPKERPAAFVKIQRKGRNESALSGLPTPVHPYDTTPVRDRDLSGLLERDVSRSTDQQYRCLTCGKTFTGNRHLNVHMRIHAKDRLIRHHERSVAAVTSKLNEHQNNQSGRKFYKCTVCDFKSVHSGSLCLHKRNHSGDKPYKCTVCGYTCAYSCYLKRHQLIHSGVKPYKCTECVYTCANISNLRRHQRNHKRV